MINIYNKVGSLISIHKLLLGTFKKRISYKQNCFTKPVKLHNKRIILEKIDHKIKTFHLKKINFYVSIYSKYPIPSFVVLTTDLAVIFQNKTKVCIIKKRLGISNSEMTICIVLSIVSPITI